MDKVDTSKIVPQVVPVPAVPDVDVAGSKSKDVPR
jgi:hypothetical protein